MNQSIYNQDNILIEEYIDNGDDTAMHKIYDKGQIISEETVEWHSSSPEIDELKQIPQSAISQLAENLDNPTINSISEVKSVLKDFISKIE